VGRPYAMVQAGTVRGARARAIVLSGCGEQALTGDGDEPSKARVAVTVELLGIGKGTFDGLFPTVVVVPQPAFAGGGAGVMASRILRPSGGIGRAIGGGSRNYFPSEVRNTIIGAGRSRTMVQLSYDGYDRVIEPYKLEYYVRKKDGRGLEYFWGWDTSGGKSGKTGIKQFICDKIISVRPTDRQFQPRFAVEL
jgi:hypothetical protein